jgi:putative ABC transport system permease protein
VNWWQRLRKRDQLETELDAELRFHVQAQVDENVRSGMSEAESRRRGHIGFGGLEQVKEGCRDVRGIRVVEATAQDVRYATRMLRKNPGVTIVALLTFTLGIGANTAIFSLVKAILLTPLPYADADRIVGIWEKRPSGDRNAMSTLNYLDYANQSAVFEHIAATTGCCSLVTLNNDAAPIQLRALRVSSPYFDILGANAALGRTFVAGDDQPGRDHVVVLSHALWSSQFGADTALIGRPIRLDAEPYTVVGVMPANSPFDRTWTQLWLPLSFRPDRMNRNMHWLLSPTGGALALLKPGITLARARAEMNAISARLAADHPNSNAGWGVEVEPYAAIIVGKDLQQSLYVLFAAVVMVLFIGCVNLANVMLARDVARAHEVAVRLALGARRGRLIRQFLTEALLLSLLGGLLGLVVGYAATAALRTALLELPLNPSMPPNSVPAEAIIGIDRHVLIFTLTLSLFSGIVFGLAPAIAATRGTGTRFTGAWRKANAHVVHRRLRSTLIVTEVALTFVLLTGAGLLIRSVVKMRQADPGFNATNVMTVGLPIRENRFSDPQQLNVYLHQVVTTLESLPGVRDVALTDGFPFQGVPTGRLFQIVGQPFVERARRPVCDFKTVSPSYFRALNLRVRKGRGLSDHDRDGSPLVTVINETMARIYFLNEDPVGQHILMEQVLPGMTQFGPQEVPWEVVGVIADERLTPFADKREHAAVYVTNEQNPTTFAAVVVSTAFDPSRIQEPIRKAVLAIDRDQATDMKTLDQLKSESMASDRQRSSLVGLFAAVALLLSAIGIYGVISCVVVQRTHEIGIRAALGASPGELRRLILRHGMALTGMGLTLGFAAALGLTRLLSTFLFGVRSSDPITLSATVGILAGVAVTACYIPARQVTRIDPLIALRYE